MNFSIGATGIKPWWGWGGWWWSWIPTQDIARNLQNTVICNPDLDPTSEEVGVAYISLQDAIDYCHAQWTSSGERWTVLLGNDFHWSAEIKEWVALVWQGIATSSVGTITSNVLFTWNNFLNTTIQNVAIDTYNIWLGAVCASKDIDVAQGTCLWIFAWLWWDQASVIFNMDLSAALFVLSEDIVTEWCTFWPWVSLVWGSHTSNTYNGAGFVNAQVNEDSWPNTFNQWEYFFIGVRPNLDITMLNWIPSWSVVNISETFCNGDWDMPAWVEAFVVECWSGGLIIPQDASCILDVINSAIDVDNSIWCTLNVRWDTINTQNFSNLTNPPEWTNDLQVILEEIDSLLWASWGRATFVDTDLWWNDPSRRLYNNFEDAYNALLNRLDWPQYLYLSGTALQTLNTGQSYDLKNVKIASWSGLNSNSLPIMTFEANDTIDYRPMSIENMFINFNNTGWTCGLWSWETVVCEHKNVTFNIVSWNFAILSASDNTTLIISHENCTFLGAWTMYRCILWATPWEVTIYTKDCDFQDAQVQLFANDTNRTKNFYRIEQWDSRYAGNDIWQWLIAKSQTNISHASWLFSTNAPAAWSITDITMSTDANNRDIMTVTTSVWHSLSVGSRVEISWVTPTWYNSYYEVLEVPNATQVNILVDWQGINPWPYTSGWTIALVYAQKIMSSPTFWGIQDVITYEAFVDIANNLDDKRFKIVAFRDAAWNRPYVELVNENYNTAITETQWQIRWVMEYGWTDIVYRGYSVVDNAISQHTSWTFAITIGETFEMWLVLDAPSWDLDVHTFALSHNKRKWIL